MTPGNFQLMFLLHDGPCNMSRLAEYQSVSLPTISRSVSRLEKLGWLRRSSSPHDRRVTLVELTEDGRMRLEEIGRLAEETLGVLLGPISETDAETLAADIIKSVGPAGNFLAESHTVEHFRRELWLPGELWARDSFDGWQSKGCSSFAERLTEHVNSILKTHTPQPLDEALSREIDDIVKHAERELG